MRKIKYLSGSIWIILALILSAVSSWDQVAHAAFNFNDPAFAGTWNQVDKPVAELPGIGRGYTWGPPAPGTLAIINEPYNGSTRPVQYFDKARMELNPRAPISSIYHVTTGLLVKEMVTGARQDGDYAFTQLAPSTLQIAGDPNFEGANTIAPTYASFRGLGTFFGTENMSPNKAGSVINSRVDRAGNVTLFNPPETRTLKTYNSITHHNIADVFADFASQSGTIWNGTAYVQGGVMYGDPTFVLGLPLTEPYWLRAVVAGVERNVLVQLFERRALTYTPGNPKGFEVEMGNVGQHYYFWRYIQNAPLPVPAGPILVPAKGATVTLPLHIMAKVGQPGEVVKATVRWQDGTVLTDSFTTLRNSDGTGLLFANLDFKNEGPPPIPATQAVNLDITRPDGSLLARQAITLLAGNDPNTSKVKVYFVLTGTQLMYETRTVPKTVAVGRAALEELLWGPSPRNLSGATSAIPDPQQVLSYLGRQSDWGPRVTLLDLDIENGVATANFSQELKAYGGGSLRVKLIRDQITTTLKQFSSVTSVQIAIEGQTEGVLEP